MDKLLYVGAGAALVGAAWLAVLVGKHGWAWVRARLAARAQRLEAEARAKLDELTAPFEQRVKTLETIATTDVANLKADVAALKTKVGI